MILKEGEGGYTLGIFAKKINQNLFLYRKYEASEVKIIIFWKRFKMKRASTKMWDVYTPTDNTWMNSVQVVSSMYSKESKINIKY